MNAKKLKQFRREYLSGELREQDVSEDPHNQLLTWLEAAINAGSPDPGAMALATADAEGKPSVRMVLLKEARETGLVFFSNYESRKGKELQQNPEASAMFFWPEMERQLRVEGIVEKLSEDESDAFFNSRPRESRIISIVSEQSKEIPGREYLLGKANALKDSRDDTSLKRPTYWGGYILKPVSYEFWQGREHRLNDRLEYYKLDGDWKIRRLAP